MPVPSKMADLYTIPSSNSPAGSEAIGNSLDDYLRSAFAILRSTNAIASATVASASTTNIGAADAEHVQVTGTATISSFGTSVSGLVRECRFTGALTIKSSSNIVTPGSEDIAVATGDVLTFRSAGSGVWRFVSSSNVAAVTPDAALTIAKTSGLQAALNGKATSAQGAKADSAAAAISALSPASATNITNWNTAAGSSGAQFASSTAGATNGPGSDTYCGINFPYSSGNVGAQMLHRVSSGASELWFRGVSGGSGASWERAFPFSGGTFLGGIGAPTIRATSTTDVSLTSTGHAFQIGLDSGSNLRMDANEIMSVNNGAPDTLYLQNDGGGVVIGGGKAISKLTVSPSAPGTLQDGELYLEY